MSIHTCLHINTFVTMVSAHQLCVRRLSSSCYCEDAVWFADSRMLEQQRQLTAQSLARI